MILAGRRGGFLGHRWEVERRVTGENVARKRGRKDQTEGSRRIRNAVLSGENKEQSRVKQEDVLSLSAPLRGRIRRPATDSKSETSLA